MSDMAQIEHLQAEAEGLRTKLDRHPIIDQGLGMIMAMGSCSFEEAWDVLVKVSQQTNTKLRTVAEALVASAMGAPLPAPVARELKAALRARAASAADR